MFGTIFVSTICSPRDVVGVLSHPTGPGEKSLFTGGIWADYASYGRPERYAAYRSNPLRDPADDIRADERQRCIRHLHEQAMGCESLAEFGYSTVYWKRLASGFNLAADKLRELS